MTSADDLPRLEAVDGGVVVRHGDVAAGDPLGARDVWVFREGERMFMHYDAAGELGWLVALATSDDGLTWTKHGTVLGLGAAGAPDSASASYGTTYFDGLRWHMFYLGTPHATDDELRTPSFPYATLKAEAPLPTGPWRKRDGVVPFAPAPGSWYSDTASPGQIIRVGHEYLMLFSAASTDQEGRILRTLGIARSGDLDGAWTIDDEPLLPVTEQVENSSLHFESTNGLWFLFTNHVGVDPTRAAVPPQRSAEYTDSIRVYWSDDPTRFSSDRRAVVLDAMNCTWSPRIIGLPSVVRVGDRLALYYDGCAADTIGHGGRDIGLAWLDLPLRPPEG